MALQYISIRLIYSLYSAFVIFIVPYIYCCPSFWNQKIQDQAKVSLYCRADPFL